MQKKENKKKDRKKGNVYRARRKFSLSTGQVHPHGPKPREFPRRTIFPFFSSPFRCEEERRALSSNALLSKRSFPGPKKVETVALSRGDLICK